MPLDILQPDRQCANDNFRLRVACPSFFLQYDYITDLDVRIKYVVGQVGHLES